MSLMSLIRWMGVIVIAWTLVAIGIGASGARTAARDMPILLPSGSRMVEAMPRSWPPVAEYDLIDRSNGKRVPLQLPADDRWSHVIVSPWRGPDGEREAVGRWVNPGRDEFGGWGTFRLSDGAVLGRVATEILPTGLPCWAPGEARTILFAAGDGRLYRCRVSGDGHEPPDARSSSPYASGRAEPSEALYWEVPPPGLGEPMLLDPVWPLDSRLNRWIFVTLMPLRQGKQRLIFGEPETWWLELSNDHRAIVASGRLTSPTSDNPDADIRIEERFPSVTVGPEGDFHLVYLEGRFRGREYRLRRAPLEFDSRTGRPRALPGADVSIADRPAIFRLAPLLLSADGRSVYGLSTSGERTNVPVFGPERRPAPTGHSLGADARPDHRRPDGQQGEPGTVESPPVARRRSTT